MVSFFSNAGKRALKKISAPPTLYAFDFDGTLSRLRKTPSEAGVSKSTAKLLEELSVLAPVAVISGRSIQQLKERLSFAPKFLIGNHGLEGTVEKKTLQKACRIRDAWLGQLKEASFEQYSFVEDKCYSLAIHYARCKNKGKARYKIRKVVKTLAPEPEILLGKFVVNLLPPHAPCKGRAIENIIQKQDFKNVFYIGDDQTDESIFKLSSEKFLTVKVGRKKDTAARYFISNQLQIDSVLKEIIRGLSSVGHS